MLTWIFMTFDGCIYYVQCDIHIYLYIYTYIQKIYIILYIMNGSIPAGSAGSDGEVLYPR